MDALTNRTNRGGVGEEDDDLDGKTGGAVRWIGHLDLCALLNQEEGTYCLINTLPEHRQDCVIAHTLPCAEEEATLNRWLSRWEVHRPIVIYGQHAGDATIYRKYNQCVAVGFEQVFVYLGGMMEWMLLRSVSEQSAHEYRIRGETVSFLRFSPSRKFRMRLTLDAPGNRK